MKISIMSKPMLYRLIENNRLKSDTAVISFADTEDDFLTFPKDVSVLKIVFEDIYPGMIPEEQYQNVLPDADKIAKFIDAQLKANKNIICQCDYGVSRSAGLAASIMEHYKHEGIKVFASYRYSPNKLVFNRMLAAFSLLK